MTGLFLFVHTVTCILLVVVILMQSGRGGGLTEGFAGGAESMFGAKTNELMVKTTTILACVFLVTSLVLARLSANSHRSLIPDKAGKTTLPLTNPATQIPGTQPQTSQPAPAKPASPAAK